MRPIDADALDYALGASDEDIYFHHMLEDAPTIDAIPVEWLKQWRDKLKGMGEYQRERAEDISFVLGLWQKEQEASERGGWTDQHLSDDGPI